MTRPIERTTGADTHRFALDQFLASSGGAVMVLMLQGAELSTLHGVRNIAVTPPAIVQPLAARSRRTPTYTVEGLEAAPGFKLTNARALQIADRLEGAMRLDDSERDLDY